MINVPSTQYPRQRPVTVTATATATTDDRPVCRSGLIDGTWTVDSGRWTWTWTWTVDSGQWTAAMSPSAVRACAHPWPGTSRATCARCSVMYPHMHPPRPRHYPWRYPWLDPWYAGGTYTTRRTFLAFLSRILPRPLPSVLGGMPPETEGQRTPLLHHSALVQIHKERASAAVIVQYRPIFLPISLSLSFFLSSFLPLIPSSNHSLPHDARIRSSHVGPALYPS